MKKSSLILTIKASGPPACGKSTSIALAEFLFRQQGYIVKKRTENTLILTYKKTPIVHPYKGTK